MLELCGTNEETIEFAESHKTLEVIVVDRTFLTYIRQGVVRSELGLQITRHDYNDIFWNTRLNHIRLCKQSSLVLCTRRPAAVAN